MRLTTDWHIHSQNSCDSACITVKDLIARTSAKGITDFGLTDHLHTSYNLPDIAASREEFLASNPSPRFHFGIEVSCVSQWEIDELASGQYENPVYGIRQGGPADTELAIGINELDVRTYGIEFVVGGAHWPMYVPQQREAVVRDYHRQNMFLATHPLVDIVAHPWWWMGWWKDDNDMYPSDPWLDDFPGKVPRSMHDELASAALQHNKVIEINLGACLFNWHYPENFRGDYLNFLAYLESRGVKLSIGSDCHNAEYNSDFDATLRMLQSVGITTDDLWCLPPRES